LTYWPHLVVALSSLLVGWLVAVMSAGYKTGRWAQRSDQANQAAEKLDSSVGHLSEAVHALDKQVLVWTNTVINVKERLSWVGGQLTEQDRLYREMFITKGEALPLFAKAAEDHKRYDQQFETLATYVKDHGISLAALQEWQKIVKGDRPNRRIPDSDD
jgi:hypothetical protein